MRFPPGKHTIRQRKAHELSIWHREVLLQKNRGEEEKVSHAEQSSLLVQRQN